MCSRWWCWRRKRHTDQNRHYHIHSGIVSYPLSAMNELSVSPFVSRLIKCLLALPLPGDDVHDDDDDCCLPYLTNTYIQSVRYFCALHSLFSNSNFFVIIIVYHMIYSMFSSCYLSLFQCFIFRGHSNFFFDVLLLLAFLLIIFFTLQLLWIWF